MFNFPTTKQEFYEKQSKEQLIVFLKNQDYIERTYSERLFLLTGCGDFGNSDGTVGSCVDCCYENHELWEKCHSFTFAYHDYRKNKLKEREKDE